MPIATPASLNCGFDVVAVPVSKHENPVFDAVSHFGCPSDVSAPSPPALIPPETSNLYRSQACPLAEGRATSTPRTSAAAERSAMRALSPFIASAAAIPIVDARAR